MKLTTALLFGGSLLSASALQAQDTRVVRSSGPGAWGASLRLVEELRIGQLEGAEAYTFGFVVELAVGKDGAILVGEARPNQLRMYDASGRFVRKIGGAGEGPGEYRQINGLKTMSNGDIALFDGQAGRISVFDGKGEFRTSYKFHTGFFTANMFLVDTAGNFYLRAHAKPFEHSDLQLDMPEVYIKLNSAGQVVDSLEIPQGATPSVQTYGGPGVSRVMPLLAALSPHGYFVTGSPMNYSFSIAQAQKPTLVVVREHKPLPLAGAERAEWEAFAEYYSKLPISQSFRSGPDGKSQRIDGPSTKYVTPRVKPAYRALRVDDEGRIWVERHVAAEKVAEPPRTPPNNPGAMPGPPMPQRPPLTWREPRTLDAFDPSGRFLGTVVTARNFTPMIFRGTQIWGTMRGEFDEQYIVRYRIEPAR